MNPTTPQPPAEPTTASEQKIDHPAYLRRLRDDYHNHPEIRVSLGETAAEIERLQAALEAANREKVHATEQWQMWERTTKATERELAEARKQLEAVSSERDEWQLRSAKNESALLAAIEPKIDRAAKLLLLAEHYHAVLPLIDLTEIRAAAAELTRLAGVEARYYKGFEEFESHQRQLNESQAALEASSRERDNARHCWESVSNRLTAATELNRRLRDSLAFVLSNETHRSGSSYIEARQTLADATSALTTPPAATDRKWVETSQTLPPDTNEEIWAYDIHFKEVVNLPASMVLRNHSEFSHWQERRESPPAPPTPEGGAK